MKMKKTKLTAIILLFVACLQAQTVENGIMRFDELRQPVKRELISIPDVNGYKVLKCDFHIHTVFSDGLVWPTVRIEEAWRESLDALSITDHVGLHPFRADVKIDHNRAYEIAEETAKKSNILLIKGTEITRTTPPGHFNALFVGDVSHFPEDRLIENDRASVMLAKEQGAFIFWNHPGWRPLIAGSYEWLDFIEDLYQNNALHGIEVFNGFEFHKKALDWCIDKGLTVLGTSDIHNLVRHEYDLSKNYVHRTMTLVMAKDRTPESIREALEAGRTVAWASKYLAGKEENVRNLFNACVEMTPAYHTEERRNGTAINYYEIRNNSSLYFELRLTSGNGTDRIVLYPHSAQQITAEAGQSSLSYDVVTAFVRSDKHLNVSFTLK
jgi:predicted metal-dependent phosphoesterase TrpH